MNTIVYNRPNVKKETTGISTYTIQSMTTYGIETIMLTIFFDDGTIKQHQFHSKFGATNKLNQYLAL